MNISLIARSTPNDFSLRHLLFTIDMIYDCVCLLCPRGCLIPLLDTGLIVRYRHMLEFAAIC
jgi:hypothetical protein